MRRFILSRVVCAAVPYFCALSPALHDYRQKVTEHKIRVLILYTTCVWNTSHSKKNWARYHECTYVFTESSHYSYQMLTKPEFFSTDFRKTQISKIIRIRPVGAELFHADGQDVANSRFSQVKWNQIKCEYRRGIQPFHILGLLPPKLSKSTEKLDTRSKARGKRTINQA